MLKIIKFQF